MHRGCSGGSCQSGTKSTALEEDRILCLQNDVCLELEASMSGEDSILNSFRNRRQKQNLEFVTEQRLQTIHGTNISGDLLHLAVG